MELASGKGLSVASLHGGGKHKKLANLLNLSY